MESPNFAIFRTKYTDAEKDATFKKYRQLANMSASELDRWSKTECSRLAGLSRAPIRRNLELKRTKREDWTTKHYRWANRSISFISRMRGNLGGKNELTDTNGRNCGTKAVISLKNWAHNPNK